MEPADKVLIALLLPFFTILLAFGALMMISRDGKPLNVKLKGLGIQFELTKSAAPAPPSLAQTSTEST